MTDQDDVLAYYGTNVAAGRLAAGAGAIELERTKEILDRYLEPGSTIADVGGAVGHYAEWLVESGHRVLEDELSAAGLEVEGVYGVEGPGWLLAKPDDTVEDGTLKGTMLASARVCETDREMAAVSAHLLAVGRVPG